MRRLIAVSSIAAALVMPTVAWAWGSEGHQIIARIASSELTPGAKAQVEALLGDDATSSMVTASTWADEIRPTRQETRPWHYVDIEITSSGYDAARDCPNDACVVAQVKRDVAIIGNRWLAKPVRAEALRFL